MPVEINNDGDSCLLKITEDLTIFHVAEYHEKMIAECNFKGQVSVDLAEIEDADTAGVQLILSLKKKVDEASQTQSEYWL